MKYIVVEYMTWKASENDFTSTLKSFIIPSIPQILTEPHYYPGAR